VMNYVHPAGTAVPLPTNRTTALKRGTWTAFLAEMGSMFVLRPRTHSVHFLHMPRITLTSFSGLHARDCADISRNSFAMKCVLRA
jgi:hypothetical protein